MTECRETHEFCKRQTPQPLPTRLIDVEQRHPRLVLTKGKTGVYATLSYCWGLSADNPYETMYTTTEATVQARMEGMPLNEMPKTLQDAVVVTRALGLQYLWIDALCIIQDSKSDVAHEISNMASVYGNCELVVCAANSSSSKEGFLKPRDALRPLVTMPYVPSDGGDAGTYGFYDAESFPSRDNWSSIEDAEWNRRAWTFQERVVSPRVLHFGSDIVRLECRTSDFSELGCCPRRLVVGNTYYEAHCRYLGVLEYLSSRDPVNTAEIYETYYKFACQYSKRLLSFESDRESAFSAVVTQFARALPASENVYGLWVDDPWRSLVWNLWGNSMTDTRTNKTTSRDNEPESIWPSWSWYSCPRPVTWHESSNIWSAPPPQSFTPQGSNSPNLISITRSLPSSLVVSAVLIHVGVRVGTIMYGSGLTGEILVDGERWGNANLDTRFDSKGEKNEREDLPLRNIQLLQLMEKCKIYDEAGRITMHSTAGLALEPSGAAGCYGRIGIFTIDSQEKWENLFEGREQTQVTLI